MLSLVLLYSYRDRDETNVAFLAAVRGGQHLDMALHTNPRQCVVIGRQES
jgi:hypothetical protein